jgi:hypothetical protein
MASAFRDRGVPPRASLGTDLGEVGDRDVALGEAEAGK